MDVSRVSGLPSLFCQLEVPITCFANELLLRIFSRFKAQDLFSVTSTCKRFYEIKKDRSLWEALFKQDFPRLTASPERSFFSNYVCNNTAWKKPPPFLDIARGRSYSSNVAVHDNLVVAEGENSCIKIWDKETGILQHRLVGHPYEDINFIYIRDGLLFSNAYGVSDFFETRVWSLTGTLMYTLNCSWRFVVGKDRFWGVCPYPDPTRGVTRAVKIWDKTNGALICSIDEDVSTFILDNNRLITGSSHGVIKNWDTNDYSLLGTMGEFQQNTSVRELVVDQEFLFAAYEGGVIKIWNTIDTSLITSIEPYGDVFDLTIKGEVLFVEAGGTFKAWDKNDLSLLYSVDNYSPFSFLLEGNMLVLGLKSGVIQMRDVRTGHIILEFSGHPTTKLELPHDGTTYHGNIENYRRKRYKFIIDGNRLISYGTIDFLGREGEVKVWDIGSGELLVSLEGQTQIALDQSSLVTCLPDERIRIWDFSARALSDG